MSGLQHPDRGNDSPVSSSEELLLRRRARMARMSELGRRVGYLAFGLSIGTLALGLATGFTDGFAVVVIGLLAGGSVVLAPAILVHYAVRGAEREETKRDS